MVIISLMILIIAIALTSVPTSAYPIGESNQSKTGSVMSYGREGISPILFTRLTSIIFLFSGALSYNALYIQSIGSGLSIYSGLYQVTVLSQSFDLVIYILASLILIPWSNNIKSVVESKLNTPNSSLSPLGDAGKGLEKFTFLPSISGPLVKEYSLIVLFSTLGSSLLLSSGNLLSMYLSIELQSFGVYILASIYRDSESATNAGLKYFLLGGLSSCLILLGCVLIYSYTGVINFEDIYSLLVSASGLNNDISTILQLGLILIFIGFLFKIAAAPFHNWAPDVYNDVPSIVTTWLTIMPKIAIIILASEIINTINLDVLSSQIGTYNFNLIKNLLLISSFLSLIIGTIVGLAQTKIKRLLAYSTISHVGFLLLALSINTEESLESLLFYLIQYSFTNLNIFLIILSFGYILKRNILNNNSSDNSASGSFRVEGTQNKASGSDINLISELKGQFISNPLLSLSMAISLFSMAGIPPLLGFFAKAGVLYSSTQNGYYFISLVAIIVSVISAYYYLQIIRVMHFDNVDITNNNTAGLNPNLTVTNTHSFIISILTLSIILFILKPSILLNSIHLMALNIFYF